MATVLDDLYADDGDEHSFLIGFYYMQDYVHNIAVDKGWWDEQRNDGELIALCHSELSEALEYMRNSKGMISWHHIMSDHIPEYTGVEEELADVIIRIMDMAAARGYRIADALVAKAEFNKSRSYKHGKSF